MAEHPISCCRIQTFHASTVHISKPSIFLEEDHPNMPLKWNCTMLIQGSNTCPLRSRLLCRLTTEVFLNPHDPAVIPQS